MRNYLYKILKYFIKFISIFTKNKEQTRTVLCKMWISSVKNFMNTKEWLEKENLLSNYKTVKEIENIKFDAINHVETVPWSIFEKYLELDLKEVFVVMLPNTRYIPDWSSYITSDNILLNDLTHEFGSKTDLDGFEHTAFKKILPEETYMDQNIAILDSAGSHNYFHWFINILPKIEFFEQAGMEIDKYLIDVSKSFQIDSLKRIGFPMDKILPVSDFKNLRAKNIIASPIPTVSCANLSSLDFLRDRLHIQNQNKTERIFISRKKALQERRVTNEDKIMELLSSFGFKSYVLEDMTFQEQVELFSNAETIISPHGAGLTNMLFAPKGTNIVEMFNPEYQIRCYCILANSLEHNYFYIKGEGPEESDIYYDCRGSMTIDMNKIKKLVNMLNLNAIKV